MNKFAAAIGLAVVLFSSGADARQVRTLDAFVTEANRVPLNPTAMLRSDARRLAREFNSGMDTVSRQFRADRAAGRAPAACPPERIRMNPRQLLAFLNGIPQARRRQMTVPDGLRLWLADGYPCPRA